ncbi:hypothetical protein BJX63DRAFT_409167 [Aspergillus granulosus]|uniref:Glucose-methanol-choline oxidoreductase N-terminal domain-containing protein n=1 Tax=Aspergillus granulosus TaxID=176169 RepID=A0ABR4GZ31_9EURO
MGRMALLLSLASLAASALALVDVPKNHGVSGVDATYDYVIIGGGTSGLAIAARLAEDPELRVAVIEAGGYYEIEGGPPSTIPGLAGTANTGTDANDTSKIDWNFIAEPLTEGHGRELRYARGRTLGGSSARHYMVYQRGTKGTYDEWAEMIGDDSWTWDSVLPFFKQSVTVTPADMSVRAPNTTVYYDPDGYSPDGAPLQVTWPNYGSPFSTYVEIGLEAVGVARDTDFNTGYLDGSSWAPITVDPKDQTRSSSETSFLREAYRNTDLVVYPHTMALKIEFEGTTATGVQARSSAGVPFTLTARKEVILSAGTFQSPQMLMVSGIGPEEQLEAHGIEVIKDLPGVGQNLWDHCMFGVVNEVNVITSSSLISDAQAALQAGIEYTQQRGPLTAPGFGVIGWQQELEGLSDETQEALSAFPDDWPILEYLSLDGILDGWHSALDQFAGKGHQWASLAVGLVAPLSRGNITIRSDSADDAPVIELGYLTHPGDQEVAIAAVKRLREVWAATGIAIGEEYRPGPSVQTDEEILEFIRSTVVPVFHAAGTCAMGKESDPLAVVDSTGKVFGVNNLRVVDASIFPTLPAGHPQSSCYMVAEKIAADIKSGN